MSYVCSITFKFVTASAVYYVTSVLFPARETFVEKLILAEDRARCDSSHLDTLGAKGDDVKCHGKAL